MTPRPHDATELGNNGRGSAHRPCAHRLIANPVIARPLIAGVLLAVVTWPLVTLAQPPGTATRRAALPAASPQSPSKDASGAEAPAGQPVFGLLRPEDGAVVPLPAGTRYEEFLSWIAARRGPGYGVNSVKISGQVGSDGSADLDVEIVVVVHRENEWVRVPLGFGEGTLVEFEHTGSGDVSYESLSQDLGHTASLQGRGEHRLQLKLLVPLIERSGEARLTVSTPSNAATTKLQLNIPSDPTVSAVGGILKSTFSADQQTSVEWIGAGGRIDLTWRPQIAAAQPADLAASTIIVPSVTSKTVQLRAVQKITPSRGQVAFVRTRLPAGFSLESVTGALYQSHSEETTEAGKVVTVQLSEATDTSFELTYRANAPLPSDGTIVLDGFSLPNVPAEAQSGRIQFERATGYSIQPIDGSEGIQKMAMVEPMPTAVSSAYIFASQPFHFVVKVEPIAPSLLVAPELQFHILPDRIDLDAEFAVEVRKGELREIRLNWPGSEWSVSPIRAGPVQEFPRMTDTGSSIEMGVTTTASAFLVPVKASLSRSGDGPMTVRLPRLGGTARQKVDVVTEALRVDLEYPLNLAITVSAGDKVLNPQEISASTAGSAGLSNRVATYVIPADTLELTFDVRKLVRQVEVTSRVSLTPRGDQFRIRGEITYDIQNEPLSSLRLTMPDSLLAQGIEFMDAEKRQLPMMVGDRSNGNVEVVIDPGTPLIGRFAIATTYDLPRGVPVGASGECRIPVVEAKDADLTRFAFDVSPMRRHSIRVASPGWVRLQSTQVDAQEHWVGATPAAEIVLALYPRDDADAKSVVVSRLLQRSLLRRDGNIVTYADIQFAQVPPTVAVRFPGNVKPDSFSWRGRPVTPVLFADGRDDIAEITLPDGSGPPILAVSFKQAGDGVGLATGRTLASITLDDAIVRETLWRLTLPESQHLFQEPDDYEPQNLWGIEGGLLWPRHSPAWINEWFGADVPRISPEFDTGHVYDFVRAGGPLPLAFSSISRSLVVLIGAGTSILLGYAFASGFVRHRRNTLIGLLLALLLLWTFFPYQVQIFLQPAAFGLLLVAIAAVAEWLLQRRQDRFAATAQSAVDFVTILPGDGSHSAAPSAIGSEEPTVVRSVRPQEPVGSSHGSMP